MPDSSICSKVAVGIFGWRDARQTPRQAGVGIIPAGPVPISVNRRQRESSARAGLSCTTPTRSNTPGIAAGLSRGSPHTASIEPSNWYVVCAAACIGHQNISSPRTVRMDGMALRWTKNRRATTQGIVARCDTPIREQAALPHPSLSNNATNRSLERQIVILVLQRAREVREIVAPRVGRGGLGTRRCRRATGRR